MQIQTGVAAVKQLAQTSNPDHERYRSVTTPRQSGLILVLS